MDFPILTTLILLPAASAVVVLALPRRRTELVLPVAIALSLLTLGAAGWMLYEFEVGEAGFQFVEHVSWYEDWGVAWHVGVDGISLFLVVLTAFLFPIALLASTSVTTKLKQYVAAMLLLEAAIIGVFVTLDLLVFFVFWEAVLVPMYFIIGIWGGERRVYAAVKFFLYTAFGSALMFAGSSLSPSSRATRAGALHSTSSNCSTPTSPEPRSSGCSQALACHSPSRFPFSPSTPGYPMPMSKHRLRAR